MTSELICKKTTSSNRISTNRKALAINLDDSRYGSFAEIGAGQEVARHFFQAGRASHSVAKTMSAYDMTFSDEIYGKEDSGRYVCESRVVRMLKKEYQLLDERLTVKRGESTCFFSFANTVATSSKSKNSRCHGWMGVRFQTHPMGPTNDIIIHVKMNDKYRLQQQEALGIVGVNLLHTAFYQTTEPEKFIPALVDNLDKERIEIDMIRFNGPDLKHIDNRIMSLELVKEHLAPAVLFSGKGEVLQASDALYGRPTLIQRGTFRPVTKTNVDILEKGLTEFEKSSDVKGSEPAILMEMTINNLSHQSESNEIDNDDFLDRVETLQALGHNVLISNFVLYYELKNYIRQCTDKPIGLVIGAAQLPKLFAPVFYENTEGGILGACSQLFDDNTKLFVYPFKTEELCTTAKTFIPISDIKHLYTHCFENGFVCDISGCDSVDTSIHSETVRMHLKKNKDWEELVPPKVATLIKKKGLFGYFKK